MEHIELKQKKVKGHKFAKSFFLNCQKGLPECTLKPKKIRL